MKYGKREMPRKWNRKGLTAIIAVALILTCTVGGTLAWLATKTETVVNTFVPTKVTTDIYEEGEDTGIKSNVKVTNTGTADAYVRAAVVVNWIDDDGNVCAKVPVEGENGDYTCEYDKTGAWVKGNDDFWYYTKRVASGETTEIPLITSCKPNKANENGYRLQVTILAEGIQADGMGANSAQDAWAKAAESANS